MYMYTFADMANKCVHNIAQTDSLFLKLHFTKKRRKFKSISHVIIIICTSSPRAI